MSSRRILIADDTAFFLQSFADAFSAGGDEVLVAVDGLEAVHQYRRNVDNLDLVVLDLLMPKMTGYDVIRAIRQSPAGKRMPILVISEVANQGETARRLVEAGANAFLSKSTNPAAILSEAAKLLADPTLRPRRHRRAAIDLIVFLETGEESSDFAARDLSVGGLGVAGESPAGGLPERAVVRFSPPGLNQAVGVGVRRAWQVPGTGSAPTRAGLEFLDLPATARLAIEEYVSNTPRSHEGGDGGP